MDVSGSAPLDLTAIVGLKFTFVVNININSFYSVEKIFMVDSILETHGRKQSDPLMLYEHSLPPTQDSQQQLRKGFQQIMHLLS
jgi:hypothetical protein